jgi:hypothetical protein
MRRLTAFAAVVMLALSAACSSRLPLAPDAGDSPVQLQGMGSGNG